MVEALFRFGIEFVRYYEQAMTFGFLGYEATWNQVVSLLLFGLGLAIYIFNRKIVTESVE